MEFSIPATTNITKGWILQKISEESIFSYYYGERIRSGKLFRSKIRVDNKPTCSFYRSKNNHVYYHDFATGAHYDCVSYVMAVYQTTYYKALRIIANDFGLINDKDEKPKVKIFNDEQVTEHSETIIQVETRKFTPLELKWWNSFGISEKTLHLFKVFACNSVFINGNYSTSSTSHNLVFGYFGGTRNGNQLWRIYFPLRKTYRFLSNWNKSYIQGARQLPESGEYLICTKSLKDVMLLHELGIPAIAPCSEHLFLSKSQLARLKTRFNHIIVLYDNDLPGVSNLQKIRKEHPELNYFIIPRKYKAKDASDFCKLYGIEKTKECAYKLIDYFINGKANN